MKNPIKNDPMIRAWAALIVLSMAATAVAMLRPPAPGWVATAAGAAILGLAWVKAGIVLNRYLELSSHAGPRRAFGTVLGLWAGAALTLYVIAG